MKKKKLRSLQRGNPSPQIRGLRREIKTIHSTLGQVEESKLVKAIRTLTLSVQFIAGLTAVGFFIVWILEADDRRDERNLRAFNTSLRKAEIVKQSKYSKPLPGLDEIVRADYKKSSKSKSLCDLDVRGLSVSLGVLDNVNCLFIVDKSIIHETIINGKYLTALPFGYEELQNVQEKFRPRLKATKLSDGTDTYNPHTLAVRKSLLNIDEITVPFIDIRGSVAMNINKGRAGWHSVGSIFTNINLNAEFLSFKQSYLHNSKFIYKDYGTLVLEDVVLDNTIIDFSSGDPEGHSDLDEPISRYIIMRNVCSLNHGAITGIELPECRFEQLRELTKPINSSEKESTKKEIDSFKSQVEQNLKSLSQTSWHDSEWSGTGRVFGILTSQYPYLLSDNDLGPLAMNRNTCDPYFLYESKLESKNEELTTKVEFVRLFRKETKSNLDVFLKSKCVNSDLWSDEIWDQFFDMEFYVKENRPESLNFLSNDIFKHIIFLQPDSNSKYEEDEFESIFPDFKITD